MPCRLPGDATGSFDRTRPRAFLRFSAASGGASNASFAKSEGVNQPDPRVVKSLVLALVEDLAVRQVGIGKLDRHPITDLIAQRQLRLEQHARAELDPIVVEPSTARLLLFRQARRVGRRQLGLAVGIGQAQARPQVEAALLAKLDLPVEAGGDEVRS